MRRALLAGVALGVVAGLLFMYHDAIRLSVAWPVVLGFALWGAVGRDGSRGLNVAVAAGIGVVAGYAAYAVNAEFLPITPLWLGLSVGVAVGVLALIGVLAGDMLPVSGLLVGFAAFAGMFEPLWAESPAAVRTDGIETLTVALLAVLLGVLTATVFRALADRVQAETVEERKAQAVKKEPGTGAAAAGDMVEGRAS